MAIETLASVSNALSQTFAPNIARQFNRQAILLSMLEARVGRGDAKNVAWDTEFSGATAGSVAEGSDVQTTEYTTDTPVPAILPWGTYRSSFQITENEIDAAAMSMGSPTALMDMFGERVMNAVTKLASVMNADAFSGTGVDGNGNPNIQGLFGGSTDATGVYAGINRSTYTEWAGNVLANSGIARPLTFDLLYQLEQQIFIACGERPTHIVTTAGVFRKYAGLFEAIRRIPGDAGLRYDTGPALAQNGEGSLFFDGIPVIRDRNAPTGKLAMINANYLDVKFLPHVNPGDAFGYAQAMAFGTTGGDTGQTQKTPTPVPVRIVLLAKTGDSVKASVKAVVQLAFKRPNAFGYIADISET